MVELTGKIFHEILNKVEHGFLVIDSTKRLIYWNQWFHDLFEKPLTLKNGMALAELFSLDPRVKAGVERALASKTSTLLSQSFNPHPFALLRPTGQRVMQKTSIQPLSDPDGQVYCLISITDITASFEREQFLKQEVADRKKAEGKLEDSLNELKQTQQQLVQSAKLASLGEMSAGIGHELNNPLFFIMGFNNRIRAKFQRQSTQHYDDLKSYLDDIDINCQRIKSIIGHMRDFSRQSEFKKAAEPINQIVRNAFILFSERLRLKNISVKMNLAPDSPMVYIDANRIEQVIFNLINNAIDAIEGRSTKEVEGVIETETSIHDGKVLITITDNGTGIAEQHLHKIFDPFFTTKDVGKGTGLGLSISFGIIKDHHGTLECKTKPGLGSVFTIILPLHQNPGEDKLAG